ncbi:MAG: hypothetical protein ACRDJE_04805 [Dehalococcoidia bacterium]
MDSRHLHQHLRELIEREPFLRSLRPDTERYKLWLGDIVELVNVVYGADSAEMSELRAAIGGRVRLPAEATEAERQRDYVERIDMLVAVLRGYERNARD